MQVGKNFSPLEGIEPSTYGLEVHRAIHCAIGACITDRQRESVIYDQIFIAFLFKPSSGI